MPEPVTNSLIVGAIAVVAIMFFFWLSQVFTKNAGVIDIGWALGLAVLAGIYTIKLDGYPPRQIILLCMVSFWAIRLSYLLIRRIIKSKKEDSRYQLLRKDWAPNINFKALSDGCPEINVIPESVHQTMARAISNSFGFGGTNAAIILNFEL